MCVKLPLEDLNPDPCPPHPTSIYTCVVTTATRVRDGILTLLSNATDTNYFTIFLQTADMALAFFK